MLLTSPPKPAMKTSQVVPVVASGPQSATNSMTLPTMSNAPTSETHLLRDTGEYKRGAGQVALVGGIVLRPGIGRAEGGRLPLSVARQALAGIAARRGGDEIVDASEPEARPAATARRCPGSRRR